MRRRKPGSRAPAPSSRRLRPPPLPQLKVVQEPLPFHDLRATFVTWAKGDGWISDRTGHLTPEMIERYSRAERTLADLKIEPFPELAGKIPELAKVRLDGVPEGDGAELPQRRGRRDFAGARSPAAVLYSAFAGAASAAGARRWNQRFGAKERIRKLVKTSVSRVSTAWRSS